jgi:hypothetical protein
MVWTCNETLDEQHGYDRGLAAMEADWDKRLLRGSNCRKGKGKGKKCSKDGLLLGG